MMFSASYPRDQYNTLFFSMSQLSAFLTGIVIGVVIGVVIGFMVRKILGCCCCHNRFIGYSAHQRMTSDGSISGSIVQNNGILRIGDLQFTGSNIIVRDGEVWVDGEKVHPPNEDDGVPRSRHVYTSLSIAGDVESVMLEKGSLTVTGNVSRAETNRGKINIGGDCTGSCHTNRGDIKIHGNYDAPERPYVERGSVKIRGSELEGRRRRRRGSVNE